MHKNKVMVVPADLFKEEEQGIITGSKAHRYLDLMMSFASFKERTNELERNKEYRQVVNYCLVQENKSQTYILMQRCEGQGEERLKGKHYVGVGGHVDELSSGPNILSLYENLGKELREEVGIILHPSHIITFQGLILTAGDEVSDVHIGVLWHLTIPSPVELSLTEEANIHNAKWAGMQEIRTLRDKLENWSKMVYWQYAED